MGGLPFRLDVPAGLATVLGSLPLMSVTETTRFMREVMPDLVSAPMVGVAGRGSDAVESESFEAFRSFVSSMSGRVEPIVVNLTGPVTVLLDLRRSGVDRGDAPRRAREAVEVEAHRMLDVTHEHMPDAEVLVVLDEPALANSMHPTFPLEPGEVEELVTEVVADLAEDVTVGVRVDGRADWSMLLRTGIGVLGAPVTAQLETAAADISRFLERGGVIAWGAVPTDEPLGTSADRLWRRLSALWCEMVGAGIDPQLLRERSIITTAGELSSFGVSQAERAIVLAQDLASRVFRQARGLQLTIGA
jgi:hypothetical protein